MRKKVAIYLFFFCLGLALFMPQNISLATESDDESVEVSDLVFDSDNSFIRGKTVPYANIFVENLVGDITADENGDFYVPVTNGSGKVKLIILDYLTNRSTTIDFDLDTQVATPQTEETNILDTHEQETRESISESITVETTKEVVVTNDSSQKETKEQTSPFPFILLAIVIIIGGIASYWLIQLNKKKKEEPASEKKKSENKPQKRTDRTSSTKKKKHRKKKKSKE